MDQKALNQWLQKYSSRLENISNSHVGISDGNSLHVFNIDAEMEIVVLKQISVYYLSHSHCWNVVQEAQGRNGVANLFANDQRTRHPM